MTIAVFDSFLGVYLVSGGLKSTLLGAAMVILPQSNVYDIIGGILGIVGAFVSLQSMIDIFDRARR